MSEWLNADETADYLSISLSNLYSLAQQGRIPGHRIGKMWRFNKTDLDAWIKANRPINEFFTSVEASIELNDWENVSTVLVIRFSPKPIAILLVTCFP